MPRIRGVGAQLALALPSYADTRVENPTGYISVSANPGKVNNITITPLDPADPGADVIIRDSGDVVTPGHNCVAHGGGVRCSGFAQYIQISLGDRDDFVTNLSTIPVRVTGGDGNDHVNGGAGDTRFRGGPGDDTLNGARATTCCRPSSWPTAGTPSSAGAAWTPWTTPRASAGCR
ncbi:hypothetical protein [Nonomuraea candida]|uniref:hypothetical protein n=1 Tax=Nonomuraea candida TaxID=359159 RepID=UPI0012F939CA|nr:hypothetical protein [Nonomuraea candida]